MNLQYIENTDLRKKAFFNELEIQIWDSTYDARQVLTVSPLWNFRLKPNSLSLEKGDRQAVKIERIRIYHEVDSGFIRNSRRILINYLFRSGKLISIMTRDS